MELLKKRNKTVSMFELAEQSSSEHCDQIISETTLLVLHVRHTIIVHVHVHALDNTHYLYTLHNNYTQWHTWTSVSYD